jgi:Zn finger protein HypA/HybF involved in hydrogenase expression
MYMKTYNVFALYLWPLALSFGAAIFLSSCGHQETAGGLIGAGTGAAIGASVTGHNDQGTGAVIGALAGGLLGGAIGRDGDEEENREEREYQDRIQARRNAEHQQEIARMRAENERLKQRWCARCNRKVTLTGANSCPTCGGELIHERYCRECATVFSPTTGFHYCPYCRQGQALAAR